MAKEVICARCGTLNQTKKITKGNFLTELILWLCFIVPGLIYSFWRMSSRYVACSACGSSDLVPTGSPIGRETLRKYHPERSAAK